MNAACTQTQVSHEHHAMVSVLYADELLPAHLRMPYMTTASDDSPWVSALSMIQSCDSEFLLMRPQVPDAELIMEAQAAAQPGFLRACAMLTTLRTPDGLNEV